jgi:2-hydroxy-3-oxopropionate reductase
MTDLLTIGFVGLGEMGGPMARNLIRAGYRVIGIDLDTERLAQIVSAGGKAGVDIADVVQRCEIIATSLPSSQSWVNTVEHDILPHVRQGQILIDFGTVTPPETHRLAACFAEKDVELIDAPVSGGGRGAEQASLYMFVGGKREMVDRCMPILKAVGGPDRITYCGSSGCGQVVKGVNQLMMGLVDAAYLEAISFGVNSGVDIEVIKQAIGSEGHWRVDFNRIAQRIADDHGNNVGVKFRELPYFLHAAQEEGFNLPITKTVYECCDRGDRIVIDDHRDAPSYWHELTHQ